ncbi:membrane protein, putative [Marinobacter nitratireducens]|uniref:TVP38/TMEM64 family membrane protein n=1 Tax=Marinobacter nitratireducens TaxID=1137280 RepID=A0A072MZB7_9GAMM|nr:VTT domain-containing protein [Marinobacter nitratireducens]KEF30048.1 membrane protein, putative [Marinobacter nitratireducens]
MGKLLRWLLFGLLVLAAYLVIHFDWLDFMSDEKLVSSYLHSHGLFGLVLITTAGAVFTGVGAPRQLLAFVLGFSLGAVNGTLLSSIATALGAAGSFYAARVLLRTNLANRFERRMCQFDNLFREQTFLKILMVRLLPVGSNLITNLISGCSGIRFSPFLAGSFIGYIPQMLVFSLAGAGIGSADQYQVLLSAALFVVASLLGGILYRNHRARSLANSVSDTP